MSIKYTSNITTPSNKIERPAKKTREAILREYDEENASKARYARLKAQESSLIHKQNAERAKQRSAQRAAYDAKRKEEEALRAQRRAAQRELAAAQARCDAEKHASESMRTRQRSRVVEPLSSQEYQERTRRNFEHYEHQRAIRDPYSNVPKQNGKREVIDGRGTIDSRAFHEYNLITDMTISDEDQHEATLTTTQSPKRWKTRASNTASNIESGNQQMFKGSLPAKTFGDLPTFFKISIPTIIILIIIVIILLIRG